MDYEKTGLDILRFIGGVSNIEYLTHCSTRLRINLYDNNNIDREELEKIPGVIAVIINIQCQIVIGKEIVNVYNVINNLLIAQKDPVNNTIKTKKRLGPLLIVFIISVFQPILPAIAGGGILKSILIILDMLGWLKKGTPTYQVLDCIGSSPIYFLPILVAITTAVRLKVNVVIAVSCVSVLILPEMIRIMAEGTSFLDFKLESIQYATQVFPAILCVLFYSQTEKLFTRYVPTLLQSFLTPMLSFIVTVPITLLILGPVGYQLGVAITTAMIWLHSHLGFIATSMVACTLPFLVATGMHKPLLPYAISTLAQHGKETLYMPASLAHNIAEAGACFAVLVKSKNKSTKPIVFSAGISALCGITEPALYGVTFVNKVVLYAVIAGSAIGGSFLGYMSVASFASASPSLVSISIFASSDFPKNIIYALIGASISFSITFLITFIFWHEKNNEKQNKKIENEKLTSTPFLSNK
ncbi:PTS transporter subunit EIIC [Providencia vermicola]|uniref:PTS transporter subunit EIIC n=1 Tax=Providencia vermicola TaxID=333965 RepID=UPI0013A71D8C|nr:PTS transporter subunit EIIC [Providencia vermicola]QIC17281.1 PTS transporter subunit EIIC [Providencia vermicola]